MPNVVLGCYFNGQPDPQRPGHKLPDDQHAISALARSVTGADLVVLNDCWMTTAVAGTNVFYERVEAPEIAYRQRWLSQWQWLRRHPEVEWVWLVDVTDVTMLREPWEYMKPGVLYCGYENAAVGCEWIKSNSRKVSAWVRMNRNQLLLNCGIVAGDRRTVMLVCQRMNDLWVRTGADALHEMAFLNMVAREGEKAGDFQLVTGPRIVTAFKEYRDNGEAFFQHK